MWGCQKRNCLLSTKPKYGVSISGIASFVAAGVGREQPLEALHPGDALVVGVPGQGEDPARAQHPGDLGHRPVVVEPVEGLPAHHDVDRAGAHRDLLGGGDDVGHGHASGEDRQHLDEWVGGEHVVAGPVQHLGQLAGPGAELEDHRATGSGQPADGLVGVGRAGAVVGVGHRAERPCAGGCAGPWARSWARSSCARSYPIAFPPCPTRRPSPGETAERSARLADRPRGRALGLRRDP